MFDVHFTPHLFPRPRNVTGTRGGGRKKTNIQSDAYLHMYHGLRQFFQYEVALHLRLVPLNGRKGSLIRFLLLPKALSDAQIALCLDNH